MPSIETNGHHPLVDETYKGVKRSLEIEKSEEKALRILSEAEDSEETTEEEQSK